MTPLYTVGFNSLFEMLYQWLERHRLLSGAVKVSILCLRCGSSGRRTATRWSSFNSLFEMLAGGGAVRRLHFVRVSILCLRCAPENRSRTVAPRKVSILCLRCLLENPQAAGLAFIKPRVSILCLRCTWRSWCTNKPTI